MVGGYLVLVAVAAVTVECTFPAKIVDVVVLVTLVVGKVV
jgi:hypothetical protein